MAKVFDIGDRVTVTCEFRNTDGVLANPSTVVFKLRTPAGVESSPSATSTVVGIWFYHIDVNAPDFWYYRFVGTGAVVAAAESKFQVRRSSFAVP